MQTYKYLVTYTTQQDVERENYVIPKYKHMVPQSLLLYSGCSVLLKKTPKHKYQHTEVYQFTVFNSII